MATRRKQPSRTIVLDRSLEALPIFRLSDSAEETVITWSPPSGGRWRVLPAPGERLPGTFDQDVYVELMRRYHEAGAPADGTVTFTLHAFLRAMGRRVDGRAYEQLRSALTRLERTLLESTDCYREGSAGPLFSGQMAVLALVQIDRRRMTDRDQLGLFPLLTSNEPGDARVTIAAPLRANIAAGWSITLLSSQYWSLNSPVARRLYRLLAVARAEGHTTWRVGLEQLAEQLPLVQRFPSHLQRVLQPAHEMLVTSGAAREAVIEQDGKHWVVSYRLGQKAT